MRSRFFLGEVADRVISSNYPYYDRDLLDLIPDELLDTEFGYSDNSTARLYPKVEEIKSRVIEELDGRIRVNGIPQYIKNSYPDITSLLSAPVNSLPSFLEDELKKVRFLDNIVMTLIHW